jgi:DNA-binding transcriptional regulator/RsmH inhibitor MraZ
MDFFERKLDDKNRLTIPAEIRGEFEGGRIVITRGFGKYLHLYSEKTWNNDMERALAGEGSNLDVAPILSEKLADLNVSFRTGKTAVAMDTKQGRITLEQHLLEYANIKKDVVAVRAGAYWRLSAA